jgi:hypothetical protein
MTITQENIQTAIDSLLALDTLRVAGVIPENSFDAILYGASGMPSESEIITARDALLAMKGLQVNGNFPEIIELALYKIIAESGGGGGGTGAVSSVNGETGDVVLSAADVGAVSTVNGQTGTVTLTAANVGAVASVNGQTNVVTLTAANVGAVSSVNGETGVVTLDAADVGAVSSVAGKTGVVTLVAGDIGGLGTLATQNANSVNITGGNATLTALQADSVQKAAAGTLLLGTTANTTQLDIGLECPLINIGSGSVATTFTIGGSNDTVDFKPAIFTLNKGGAAASAGGVGFQIEENNAISSYLKIASSRDSLEFKAPNRSGIIKITPSTSGFTHEIVSTASVANRTLTLSNANLDLSSQAAGQVFASPAAVTGAASFRGLAATDLPAATASAKGAVSREDSGTFTPTIKGSTADGTQAYAAAVGSYYRIGKICVCTFNVSLTSTSGMTGVVQIDGLPFATAANGFFAVSISNFTGVTFTTNYTQLGARVEQSSSRISFYQNGSGQSVLGLAPSNISNSFSFVATVAYVTA